MQRGTLRNCLLHAIINELDGRGRDQRPDNGLGVLGVAGGQRLGTRGEFREEFVRDLPLDDDPARVEANLP
jgi:hypothetical protein